MEPARDDLPPLDGTDAMLSALLDQDPATRRDRLLALRDSDPATADSLAGMLATLEEFGLLLEPSEAAGHPTRVGPFRILAVLGHGGMGTVYLAERDGLQRRVALKVIHGAMAQSDRMRERFRREAIAATRIEHPAICPVYDVGETDGTPWIAMRFVAGRTLGKQLEEALANGAALARDDAARLIATLADGVHAAHECGLVHRDIKPGNVLLDGDGRPVLVDFGLASLDEEDGARLTRTGDFVGTPHYMAPEQIAGRQVDRRCDVYALGVVLYECLTLRTPFDAVHRESLFHQILRDEPEDPRRHNKALDRDTVTVLQTALAKDPERRYRTAAMFADDLRRLVARQPILARRAGVLLRLQRFAQRNPVAAGFVVFLLVVVGAFAAVLDESRVALARAEANEKALRANEAGLLAPMLGLERARAAVDRQENLDTLSSLYHAVARHHVAAVLRHEGVVWCARFAPQGDRILTCGEDMTARLWDPSGVQIIAIPHDNLVYWAEWSPDGACFATSSNDGRARLFSRDGGLLHVLDHGREERPGDPLLDTGVAHWVMRAVFSPDGRHVATSNSDGVVRIWNVATGKLVQECVGADKWIEPLAWSPDGRMVASAESDGDMQIQRGPYRVLIWRAGERAGTTAPASNFPLTDSVHSVAFSPDGDSVLVATRDGSARVFDVTRGTETCVLPHAAAVSRASFSPDGRHILTSCMDHSVRLWDRSGKVSKQWDSEGTPRADFLRDGRIVVTHAEHGIVVLDGDLRVLHTLRGHSDMIYWAPDLAADGRHLVSASWDGTAVVWQLHDADLPRLPVHAHAVMGMAQLADGRVASVGDDRTLCLSDLATGACERYPAAWAPKGLQRSRDGQRLLVVHNGFHGDAVVRLWDARAKQDVVELPVGGLDVAALLLPSDEVLTVSIGGPSGNQALVRGPGGVSRPWGNAIDGRGFSLACSPQLGFVAVAGWHRRIHIRDLDGKDLGWWRGHMDWVFDVAFDSSGRRLASASKDGTAVVWDLARWVPAASSAPPALPLQGHEGRVHRVAWSNGGQWLATAGSDGTTRLWDAATGTALAVLRSEGRIVTSLLFTADDRFLLTGGGDGVIQAWPTRVEHLHRLADAAAVQSRPHDAPTPATLLQLSRAIVAGDRATADRVARELFDRASATGHADAFIGIAERIVGVPGGVSRDLEFGLRAAREAVRRSEGRSWVALRALAAVHSARGELGPAVEVMRKAVALCDHEDLRTELARYEAAFGGGK